MRSGKRGYFGPAFLALALLASVLVAACSGGDEERITEIGDQVESLEKQVSEVGDQIQSVQQQLQEITVQLGAIERSAQEAQIIGAMRHMDSAGLHGMELDLAAGKEINPDWVGTVGNVIVVTEAAAWPLELESVAKVFLFGARNLEQALAAGDVAAAANSAGSVHATWHGMAHDAYAWLSGEALGDHSHDDE